MKPISGIAALTFFSLLLFGSGIVLHVAPPAPLAAAAPAKAAHAPHSGKKKPTVKVSANKLSANKAPAKTALPSTAAVGGAGNTLALPLTLAGGIGLLLSALAALGLSHAAAPAARRLLEAAAAERRKQQDEFEARNAALQAQLLEAKARKAETEAQRELVSRQFQEFFRTLPVPCFCFAASGKIIRWNAACELLYGIPAATALESTLWETIIPDAEREEAETKIKRVLAGESLHGTERRDTLAGGSPALLRCSMVPLYDAEGHILGGLSAGVEVPEIALYEQQIAELSADRQFVPAGAAQAGASQAGSSPQPVAAGKAEMSSKMLGEIVASATQTGSGGDAPQSEMSGHPAFRARLAEEIERSARYHGALSLIMLDLDGFAARNLQFGFEAGDQALQSAAAVIKSKIRTVDVLVRLGADEYAVLLPETGDAGARVAAERMRAGLAGISMAGSGGQPPQTACFGVVQLSPEVASAADLICRAQSALAAAQLSGVNTVVHYKDMPQQNPSQAKLASSAA